MKYYKNKDNSIYAYDNDVNAEFLKDAVEKHGLTPLSESEINELNTPKELTPQEKLEQLKAEFIKTIDGILNKVAQSKGYDDIISARSYAGYDNPFRAESEAFGKWSADVWQWAYALQDKVVKGEVDVSNLSIDNVLKDMPQAPSFKG